jgi:hypothetical protein
LPALGITLGLQLAVAFKGVHKLAMFSIGFSKEMAGHFDEVDEDEEMEETEQEEEQGDSDSYNMQHFGIRQALPIPDGEPDWDAGRVSLIGVHVAVLLHAGPVMLLHT